MAAVRCMEVGTAAGIGILLVLAVFVPFAAGYLVANRKLAIGLVLLLILVGSFAPLGSDQPAPWQDGYPADGDWRIVFFPVWLLVALPCISAGARLRGRAGWNQNRA